MLNFHWISNYYRVLYYRPTLLPAFEWPTDMLFNFVGPRSSLSFTPHWRSCVHYQNCQMAETTAVRFKEYNFIFIFPKQLKSLPKLLDGWDHWCTIQRMQLRFHFPKIVVLITKTVRWFRPLLYDSNRATLCSFS